MAQAGIVQHCEECDPATYRMIFNHATANQLLPYRLHRSDLGFGRKACSALQTLTRSHSCWHKALNPACPVAHTMIKGNKGFPALQPHRSQIQECMPHISLQKFASNTNLRISPP